MESKKIFKVGKLGEKFVVSLDVKNREDYYTTYQEVAQYSTLWHTDVIDIMKKHNGELMEIKPVSFVKLNENPSDEANIFEVISFNSEEDAQNMVSALEFEKNVAKVFREVKKLEKEYNSEESRTKDDIRACYSDQYILAVWKCEECTDEENDEGFAYFEDFLIDFIETNLIFE